MAVKRSSSSRVRLGVIVGVCAALISPIGTAAVAQADDGPGGSILQPGQEIDNADTLAQEADKVKLASSYVEAKAGRLSPASYRKLVNSYRKRYGDDSFASPDELSKGRGGITPASGPTLVDGPADQVSIPSSISGAMTSMTTSAAPTPSAWSRILSMGIYGQINGYYCGPAGAYMALRYKGYNTGAASGARWSLSQTNLGRKLDSQHAGPYLQTDWYGRTDFGLDRMRKGVNQWRVGSDSGFYITTKVPSYEQTLTALIQDIDASWPFFLSTVEYQGGAHYNGHPNRTIGHWVTAYGYTYEGRAVTMGDPSWVLTSSGFSGTPSYAHNTADFNTKFLSTNGITW